MFLCYLYFVSVSVSISVSVFDFVSGKQEQELELELEDSVSTCRHVIGGKHTYGSGTDSRSALGLVVVHWLERLT